MSKAKDRLSGWLIRQHANLSHCNYLIKRRPVGEKTVWRLSGHGGIWLLNWFQRGQALSSWWKTDCA